METERAALAAKEEEVETDKLVVESAKEMVASKEKAVEEEKQAMLVEIEAGK